VVSQTRKWVFLQMTFSRNYRHPEFVRDEQHLEDLLGQRDERGGGEFWLADEPGGYPCLSIVVSGDSSFAMYFPDDGHPGFRCLRPGDSQATTPGSTNFIWAGCDPGTGELVPNAFVVPVATSLSAAKSFFRDRALPASLEWFEL
jgi:hypothetical protein